MNSKDYRNYMKSLRLDSVKLPRTGYICVQITTERPVMYAATTTGGVVKSHIVASIVSLTGKFTGLIMRPSFADRDSLIEYLRNAVIKTPIKSVTIYQAPLKDTVLDIASFWMQTIRSNAAGLASKLDTRAIIAHTANTAITRDTPNSSVRALVRGVITKREWGPSAKIRRQLDKDVRSLPQAVRISMAKDAIMYAANHTQSPTESTLEDYIDRILSSRMQALAYEVKKSLAEKHV